MTARTIGRTLVAAGALATATAIAAPAHAQQVDKNFYKGKTLTYVVATAAGGGYDFYARLIADYMAKHLPGVTIVVKNMPGAGHLIGANFTYNARPDGLTIGTFNTGLIYNQLIGREGVKFDLRKMSWVGKASSDPRVLVVPPASPIKTIEDLKRPGEPFKFAVSGVGSSNFNETTMLKEALKLNIKIITGYNGNDDQMAVRRGEIDAVFGSRSSYESFVSNGYGRLVLQVGGEDSKLPQLSDMIRNDNKEAQAIVALMESQAEIARLTAGPPNIPAPRLAALQQAYKEALDEPELRAKAEKADRPVVPYLIGNDLQKKVVAALDQSPETIAMVARILDIKDPTLKAEGPLLDVKDKGREIVFKGPDGKNVNSKPSGSRTQITVAGKPGTRESLKTGLVCSISYKAGGDNEPDEIHCK
ncbi:MAG: Bug family tripartite tricarboxylate transporter substrate binding protein [Gemmatimonas sp.]